MSGQSNGSQSSGRQSSGGHSSGGLLIDLADATVATSGPKAASLARLLQAGLAVPAGFVVPTRAYEQSLGGVDVVGAARRDADCARRLVEQAVLAPALIDQIAAALGQLSTASNNPITSIDSFVAVRSSAGTEDGAEHSAAGQHDTFLGVRGRDPVVEAIRRCWVSLWSDRAVDYRSRSCDDPVTAVPTTAVLVQRLVDADVAGVLFTGDTVGIEASWGLGESVVSGQVTPDTFSVRHDTVVHRSVGTKTSRIDRSGSQVISRAVSTFDRNRLSLTDTQVLKIASVGRQIEHLFGRPHDVEWALADGRLWILQARPITATLPDPASASPGPGSAAFDLTGTPASPGRVTGRVRLVHGPGDFDRVHPGDVLVCRTTDPAWTPLFSVAAAIVTDTGGLLAHAAIVARELGLPAVLAVHQATTTLTDGALVTVDGSSGRIVVLSTG